MNMQIRKAGFALATLLVLGAPAQSAHAELYDPPIQIATLACPAGSSGHNNARFLAFPYVNAPTIWRLTIWCSAGGAGRRYHYEPTAPGAGTLAAWPGVGGAFGVGFAVPSNYANVLQTIDIDYDGDLDTFRMEETAPNTWTVYLSKAL
ncbi:MAG: hypothetical protein E6Q88_02170 [Lysobacteraceae bacterium]|nr:MAG: hypothetical protein E6Q88_02170 [Xanthomonadaceae bacterium]